MKMKSKSKNKKRKEVKKKLGLKFVLFATIVVLLFGFLIYIINIKSFQEATRKKVRLANELKVLQSELDDLIIEKQKLLAHDRIEKIATEKLNLVPNLNVNEKIYINKKELDFFKRMIDEKYE